MHAPNFGMFAAILFTCLRVAAAPPTDSDLASIDQQVDLLLDQISVGIENDWHRTKPIVDLGDAATPRLLQILQDKKAPYWTRSYAAEALGHLADRAALPAVRETWAGAQESHLRIACAANAALLGDVTPVNAEIAWLDAHAAEHLSNRDRAAFVAVLRLNSGQFDEATAVLKPAVEAETDSVLKTRWAALLLRCAGLAGDRDTAVWAAEIALTGDDELWGEWWNEPNLASLKNDERFARITGDAAAKLAAAGGVPSPGERVGELRAPDPSITDARLLELHAAHNKLMEGYWQAERAWIENDPVAVQYVLWLRDQLRHDNHESRAEFEKLKGTAPSTPSDEWVAKLRAELTEADGTILARAIRRDLLDVCRRNMRSDEFVDLYVEGASGDPADTDLLRRWTESALYFASRCGRKCELIQLAESRFNPEADRELSGKLAASLGEFAASTGDREMARRWLPHAIELSTSEYVVRNATLQLDVVERLWPGEPAPDFSVVDITGTPLLLSAFRGKVVLLDFWATWCGPCVAEVPNLIAIHREFKGAGFEIIGVSFDSSAHELLRFLEKREMNWPHVCDLKEWDGELSKLYAVGGIPEPVLIDRDGKLVARELRGTRLRDKVKELVAAPAPE